MYESKPSPSTQNQHPIPNGRTELAYHYLDVRSEHGQTLISCAGDPEKLIEHTADPQKRDVHEPAVYKYNSCTYSKDPVNS
jgi:hypothetical protein